MPLTDSDGDAQPLTRTPRWVKVIGVVVLVLLLSFVLLQIFVGGDHGPGRHSLDDGTPSLLQDDLFAVPARSAN